MRYVYIVLMCLLVSGCTMFPNVKWPAQWKSLAGGSIGGSVVATQKENESVTKISEADKKVEEARKKMELDYAKFREDLQKAYDDRARKDNENFNIISQLNYGVYEITQEKKKIDP